MMTSKEIVQRSISFKRLERLARSFRDSDICGVGCSPLKHATEWQNYPCDEFVKS